MMPKRIPLHKTHKGHAEKQPFECVALLLQGGGALGAYQAGVYEALSEADLLPNWVAGISIGAMNSAIIAGNAPEKRVEKLRQFWEYITDNTLWDSMSNFGDQLNFGDVSRGYVNQLSAAASMFNGIHGFFKPRFPPPYLREKGAEGATSYYDTSALKSTLEKFVDFDRVNSGETWLSVGATNVKSGNFVYFDTHTHTIKPEHIMASGALPPSFASVEIDGEYYWDGGLVSNTPLQWVLDNHIRMDTLAFQVDLWSAEGSLPRDMAEVTTRQKEILYSSRTRAATDRFKYAQRMRHAIDGLLSKLPPELKNDEDAKILSKVADRKVYNIVHLIYHARNFEGESKDYEFSRLSMEEHWKAGYIATTRSLKHPEILERPTNNEGVFTFDVAQHGRE
jgi:NTE family protein